MLKLNSRQLRDTGSPSPEKIATIKRNPIYIVLDDVLDTYNVGAIFRLADAVSAQKVYLCGKTTTPPDHKIKKASVNTWQWVEWQYAPTVIGAIASIKRTASSVKVIAIEQDKRSVSYQKADYTFPIALVVGHETDGVSKEVLNMADQIVEIPLFGVNKSLNVMVSCAIVLYEVVKQQLI